MRTDKPAPPQDLGPFDGILLVDKPSGPTSHDLVADIRRRFGIKKVGHGGTLDPMATGLMIILTGKGTKISESVMGFDKVYEGVMHLGITTDTQDSDGKVLTQADAGQITREQLEGEMRKLLGDTMQIPPMVSAIKQNGVPLYKLARKGQTVEREPRLIHIYRFALLDYAPPLARFELKCTKGTYVRTLCADIGTALNCGAHLKELRRTQIGSLNVTKAIPMDRLMSLSPAELESTIVPIRNFSIQDIDQ
ncbi:MAG TPA: tRNA pseudouridine(55) synthase TruB [Verrucomicrobia bacterium]|nr:MAG: tRNA pseudouridine(55) synthase TruB [Lentisphaerae bacterium GWF2_57_35]HBA83697.1 tRNA pseudouridine(55) synthase TruB [Verrucomicrobiota bacterium]